MGREPRRIVAMGASALLLGAAGAGIAAAAPKEKATVQAIVLSAKDVPAGFTLRSARSWTPRQLSTQGTYTLKQLKQWGYVVGYEAEFDRDRDGSNPQQISSDAGAYRTQSGARRSLAANADAGSRGRWRPLELSARIGDEAIMRTLVVPVRGRVAQVFFVVWRKGRFKGSITLSGVKNEVVASEAVRLAKRQERRMKRVLE